MAKCQVGNRKRVFPVKKKSFFVNGNFGEILIAAMCGRLNAKWMCWPSRSECIWDFTIAMGDAECMHSTKYFQDFCGFFWHPHPHFNSFRLERFHCTFPASFPTPTAGPFQRRSGAVTVPTVPLARFLWTKWQPPMAITLHIPQLLPRLLAPAPHPHLTQSHFLISSQSINQHKYY